MRHDAGYTGLISLHVYGKITRLRFQETPKKERKGTGEEKRAWGRGFVHFFVVLLPWLVLGRFFHLQGEARVFSHQLYLRPHVDLQNTHNTHSHAHDTFVSDGSDAYGGGGGVGGVTLFEQMQGSRAILVRMIVMHGSQIRMLRCIKFNVTHPNQ